MQNDSGALLIGKVLPHVLWAKRGLRGRAAAEHLLILISIFEQFVDLRNFFAAIILRKLTATNTWRAQELLGNQLLRYFKIAFIVPVSRIVFKRHVFNNLRARDEVMLICVVAVFGEVVWNDFQSLRAGSGITEPHPS